MYSDLKALFIRLVRENPHFESPERVYSSFSDFVEMYKIKSKASIERIGSSLEDFLDVDCLEECILLRCDSKSKMDEFIEEMNSEKVHYNSSEETDFCDGVYSDVDCRNLEDVIDNFPNVSFPKEEIAELYIKLLHKNPTFFQNSRVFNDPRMEKLFSEKQLAFIAKYKKKFREVAFEHCDTFLSVDEDEFTSALDNYEEKRMFDYMALHFEDSDPEISKRIESVVTKIINNIKYSSDLQKEFVLKYAAYQKCREHGIPMPNLLFLDRCDGLGAHYFKSNFIHIYDARLRRADSIKKFFSVISTVCHEVEHYLQDYDMANGRFSLAGYSSSVDYCLTDYLDDDEYSDYRNNYKFREVEQYAMTNGVKDASNFLRKYYNGDLSFLDDYEQKSILDDSEIESFGYHLDANNNFSSRSKFNVATMVKVFSKAPEILNYYPILQRFFDKDGNLKDWKTLALDYYNSSEKERLVYRDISEYMFSNPEFLNSVSMELLTSDEAKRGFISMIQDDLNRKKDKLFLICKKVENMSTDNLKSMDVKKYCYDITDHYLEDLELEYNFLSSNVDSMKEIMLPNGESLGDYTTTFLTKLNSELAELSNSNFTMYASSSEKLDRLVNYSTNSVIENKPKL